MTTSAPIHHQNLVQVANSLATSPRILVRIQELLHSSLTTMSDIALLIRNDPGLSARVVRMANSSYLAAKTRASTLEEALQRVGLREVARIVATASLLQGAPHQLRAYGITGHQFYLASLFSANASQLIARQIGVNEHTAYLAGLMRPFGVLVLNRLGETQLDQVDLLAPNKAVSLDDWERTHFGLNHAQVSAILTKEWEFPDKITQGLFNYSRTTEYDFSDPVANVLQVAASLAIHNHVQLHPCELDVGLQPQRLQGLGLTSKHLLEISLTALRQTRSAQVSIGRTAS